MITPSTRVPKKYWKYAKAFPDLELYKTEKRAIGFLVKCFSCGRWIPALEKFTALLFRQPNTQWTRKKWLPICKDCGGS